MKTDNKPQNYEGYQDGFSIHAIRPPAHLKTNYKRKKTALLTESWENEKEVYKSETADNKKAENPLTQANY